MNKVRTIQEPNVSGKGGIYVIKHFDPNKAPKSFKRSIAQAAGPKSLAKQILNGNLPAHLASFHFNFIPEYREIYGNAQNFSNLQRRIIYNPGPKPVPGTILVLRNPTNKDREKVIKRQYKGLHFNKFIDEIYPKNECTACESQIICPMLQRGNALYFEGCKTVHAVPLRNQEIERLSNLKTNTPLRVNELASMVRNTPRGDSQTNRKAQHNRPVAREAQRARRSGSRSRSRSPGRKEVINH